MALTPILLLALVQGLTEFLPVSSSGHLALMPHLTGAADQGVVIDVALHFGTLLAVLVYFRTDSLRLLQGGLQILRHPVTALRGEIPEANFTRDIALASLPVLLVGAALVMTDTVAALRNPTVIGWASILFAVPLYLADRYGAADTTLPSRARGLGLRHALILGAMQMLALIPGASRSGVTITTARALGYARAEAARLSMLMAIPVIAAFALLGLVDLISTGDLQGLTHAGLAASASALVAFASIHIFLEMTRRVSLLPFVLYRIGLGALLLISF